MSTKKTEKAPAWKCQEIVALIKAMEKLQDDVQVAGDKYVICLEKKPKETRQFLVEIAYKRHPKTMFERLEKIGRKQAIPDLFFVSYTTFQYLSRLPVEDQIQYVVKDEKFNVVQSTSEGTAVVVTKNYLEMSSADFKMVYDRASILSVEAQKIRLEQMLSNNVRPPHEKDTSEKTDATIIAELTLKNQQLQDRLDAITEASANGTAVLEIKNGKSYITVPGLLTQETIMEIISKNMAFA